MISSCHRNFWLKCSLLDSLDNGGLIQAIISALRLCRLTCSGCGQHAWRRLVALAAVVQLLLRQMFYVNTVPAVLRRSGDAACQQKVSLT